MSANTIARNACMESAGRRFHEYGSHTSFLANFSALFRRSTLLLALMLFAIGYATPSGADYIDYAYDEAGRLVQAANLTTGEAVRYTYDAVGNITSQISGPISTLAIGHFSPRRGPVGTQVTINGTGFSTTPANNTVRFNGVAATVISANQTKIVAAVPASATSGPVSVEVASTIVTSTESFVVTALADGPVIAAVLPNVSHAGNTVTIVGANFEPVPIQNRVRFNNGIAEVLAATPTALTVRVPADAGSGKVRVTTPRGIAVSPDDFIVVPPGNSAAGLATVERIATDGTANDFEIVDHYTYGMRMFEGKVGDMLAIGLSDMTFPAATVTVLAPDNTVLASGGLSPTEPGLQLPKLSVAGTYSVYVFPNYIGSAKIAVYKPSTASVTLGTSTPVTITPPGRRALLTFTVPADSYANVTLSGVTLSAGALTLTAPDGSVVSSKPFTDAGLALAPLLKRAGQYSLLIDPAGSIGGSLTVDVETSAAPTLGSSYEMSVHGETAEVLTFRAQPNEYLSLLTNITADGPGFGVAIVVRAPDGSVYAQRSVGTSYPVPDGNQIGSGMLSLGPTVMGGTYTMTVQRISGGSAEVALHLTRPATTPLPLLRDTEVSGAVSNGQTLITTMNGGAGQFLSLAITERDGAMRGGTATVLKPDGSVYLSQPFTIRTGIGSMGTLPGGGYSEPYRDGTSVVNIGPLPMSGTYRVVIEQGDHARELDSYSGSWRLTLTKPIPKTLAVNGARDHTRFEINGQGVLYSFTGAAGEFLALGTQTDLGHPSDPNTMSAMAIGVFDPDGNLISDGGMAAVDGYAAAVVNIGPLPVSGTYQIFMQNLGYWRRSISGIETYLSSPLTAALTSGNSAQMETTRMGQGAMVTFSAATGDHRGIRVDTDGPIAASRLKIFSPDGSQLGVATHLAQEAQHAGYAIVNIGPLPAAGTYKALIEQIGVNSASVGTFKFLVTPPATGTLVGNANIGNVPLLAGQPLRYTFAANQGSYRALVVKASGSPIGSASVMIQDPNGVTVAEDNLYTSGSPLYSGRMVLNAGPLPLTGNYTVLIKQTQRNRLAPENPPGLGLTLTAPVESASQTIHVGMQGQAAMRTFAGTAGQAVSMQVSESNTEITNTSIKLVAPNGAVLRSGAMNATKCPGCTGYSGTAMVAGGVLPLSGTYGVLVQQTGIDVDAAGTGTLDIDVTGSGANQGSTSNIATTTPGEYSTTAYTVAAGESFSVALTAAATSPASATSYSLYIVRPDGNNDAWMDCSTANTGCELAVRNVATAGTYQIQVRPASDATISGTLTIAPAVTGGLAADTPVPLSLSAVGQTAHLGFSTTTTQTLSLSVDSMTTVPANADMLVTVINSAGWTVGEVTIPASTTINLNGLPPDTYFVWIRPYFPVTADLQVTLRSLVGGTAPNNGTSVNFTGASPGQGAYYTFTAQAGESIGVALTNLVATPSTTDSLASLHVYPPDSPHAIASTTCAQSTDRCGLSLRSLARGGTYHVAVVPYLASRAISGSLTISKAVTGVLTADQPVTMNMTAPGRPALYSFTPTVGQHVTLNIGALSTAPADSVLDVAVYDSLGNAKLYATTGTGISLELANLPRDNYFVWITQQLPMTATAQVALRSTPMLAGDGSSTTVSTAAAGQAAYFAFEAQQGESIGVALTDVAASPATTDPLAVLQIYAPGNPYAIATTVCASDTNRCGLAVRSLTASGTYRAAVVPYLTTRTVTGTLTVSRAAVGTLVPNQSTQVNLSAPGQPLLYGFTALAGQHFSLNIGGPTATPAGSTVDATVYDSFGNIETQATVANGSTLELPALPADTYFVWITQPLPMTGSMQLELRSAVVAPTDGTGVNFDTGAVGQVSYRTFTAQAGDSFGLAVTNIVTTPAATGQVLRLSLFAPGSPYPSNVAYCDAPSCVLSARNLVAGTYRVALMPLQPGGTVAGTLTVTKAVTGTLTPDQAVTFDMSAPGQPANYSFTAAAGANFSVNVGGRNTTPADASVDVAVYNAEGSYITSVPTTSGISYQLQGLTEGTYYLWITQQSPMTGTMQVRLGSMPLLPTDGTPANFDTAFPGQATYYSFSAQAGDSFGLAVTNIVTTPAAPGQVLQVAVFAPGSPYPSDAFYCTAPSCVLSVRNLAAGTYRVALTPLQPSTVSGVLTISLAATASLSAGISQPVNLTQPGQPAMLSFSRATAQPLSLVIDSINSAPLGGIYYAVLYDSDNGHVTSGWSTSSITLTSSSLPAGSYTVWIYPSDASTASMTVSF